MTVKQGYKLTEVGVIPEDWEVALTQDVLVFQGGSQPEKSYFSQSKKFGFIRLIQIRDYKTDKFETYIPQKLARRFCSEDDIMIGRYGPPIFQILKGIEGAYNVALIKAKPQQNIQSTFAYYFLKQEKLFRFIENLSKRSSGQTGIDLHELKKYPLGLPTLPEQTAIANALSDADAYINSLEQLIAKKQQLKQGTMQQLLTGKKRLEGFSGEWETVELISLVNNKKSLFDDGDWIESEHIQNDGIRLVQTGNIGIGSFHDKAIKKFISEDSFNKLNCKKLETGDLLICRLAEPAGRSCIFPKLEEKAITSVDVSIFRPPVEKYSRPFLNHLLSTSKWFSQVEEHCGGTTHKRISRGALGKIKIMIPKTLPEQTAIAILLTNMDNDIQELQNKLTKAKHIKQGMMQELLTGKTRLVQPH